jgi:hypothetical protein
MRIFLVPALLAFAGLPALAETAKTDPSQSEIDRIIRTVAENESAFAKARESYTYRQTASLQEFDEGGTPHGKFEQVTDIIFTNEGRRTERVVKAPVPTLRLIQMTPEDEQDLRNIMPFVLTADDLDEYHVRYLGRQMADEIPAYVFAVKPKEMKQGKRYFTGQIWVDDRDMMIVKSYGRSIGLLKKGFDQQFPKFETYRDQVDGKYWFPVYTIANSTLHFADSRPTVKMTVRYADYKQFKAESKIISVTEQPEPSTPPPATEPKK